MLKTYENKSTGTLKGFITTPYPFSASKAESSKSLELGGKKNPSSGKAYNNERFTPVTCDKGPAQG